MKIIAKIHTDFPEKFGIPRQSGLVASARGRIVFEKEYRSADALRGLERFSHIWLLWEFSESVREDWRPTVRPPRLGGNRRVGVFATRSPFRPNPIGLSCVKLEGIERTGADGPQLFVSGADMLDGTPIYDIKPYLSYTDSRPEATCGFADEASGYRLEAEIPEGLKKELSEEDLETLIGLLEQDPRPSYQHDGGRMYGMRYKDLEIRFRVDGKKLRAEELIRLKK